MTNCRSLAGKTQLVETSLNMLLGYLSTCRYPLVICHIAYSYIGKSVHLLLECVKKYIVQILTEGHDAKQIHAQNWKYQKNYEIKRRGVARFNYDAVQ